MAGSSAGARGWGRPRSARAGSPDPVKQQRAPGARGRDTRRPRRAAASADSSFQRWLRPGGRLAPIFEVVATVRPFVSGTAAPDLPRRPAPSSPKAGVRCPGRWPPFPGTAAACSSRQIRPGLARRGPRFGRRPPSLGRIEGPRIPHTRVVQKLQPGTAPPPPGVPAAAAARRPAGGWARTARGAVPSLLGSQQSVEGLTTRAEARATSPGTRRASALWEPSLRFLWQPWRSLE